MYEIAKYFNCPKSEVLKHVYIRELPLIISKIYEDSISEQREKLFDLLMMLNINAATAGMAPSVDAIKNINDSITNRLKDIDYQFGINQPAEKLDEAGFMRLKEIIGQAGG